MQQAAEILEANPSQAMSLLKAVDVGLLDKKEYEYFILLQVNTWEANKLSIATSDTSVLKARDYFIQKKDASKAAYACFVAGKVYDAKNDEATALYNYKLADDWAEKANYTIPNFPYLKIPYNIATICFSNEDYKESLHYVDKSRKYIPAEQGKYIYNLWTLELKAVNFTQLGLPDSALYYYNQAIPIAQAHNDTLSKIRIYTNLSGLLYYDMQDNALAEEKCKEALAATPATDSINAGKLYMVLGAIYNKAGKPDSAYTNIYKAKSLLVKAEPAAELFLYFTLAKIETNKGDIPKATGYTQEYEHLKAQQAQSVNKEAEQLQALLKQEQEAKITEVLSLTEKTYSMAEEQTKTTRLMVIALCLIASVTGVLVYKNKKMEDRNNLFIAEIQARGDEIKRRGNEIDRLHYREKKASIGHIFQRRDLIKLTDWVQEKYEKNDLRKDLIHEIERVGQNNPWYMHDHYRATFYDISVAFPTLTETELRILCLLSTQLMTSDEMSAFLHLKGDTFEKTKNSMEEKVLNMDVSPYDMSLIGSKVYALILLSCTKRANPNLAINENILSYLAVQSPVQIGINSKK